MILVVVWYRFENYIGDNNFYLYVSTSCNPEIESCFVVDCSEDEEGCDTTPYKRVEILKSEAPACLEEHSCEDFSCDVDSDCTITTCSEENTEEWEVCSEIVGTHEVDTNEATDENEEQI